jgi:hypothetical protein
VIRRYVVPDLPAFVDDDDHNVAQLYAVLEHTQTQLLWRSRTPPGTSGRSSANSCGVFVRRHWPG